MLSHISKNDRPKMVDISDKTVTKRTAHARSFVVFPDGIAATGTDGEIRTKKGPVFQTAIVAGVMAAKKTHDLIPFCHPLKLDGPAMPDQAGRPESSGKQ